MREIFKENGDCVPTTCKTDSHPYDGRLESSATGRKPCQSPTHIGVLPSSKTTEALEHRRGFWYFKHPMTDRGRVA